MPEQEYVTLEQWITLPQTEPSPSPQTDSSQIPPPQTEPSQIEPPLAQPSLVPITNAGNKDMTVYSRRRRKSKGGRNLASEAPKQSEPVIAPEEPKEADVVVTPEEIEPEVSQETLINDNEHNDLDLPIAHRK